MMCFKVSTCVIVNRIGNKDIYRWRWINIISSLATFYTAAISDLVDHSHLQCGCMRYVSSVCRAPAVLSQKLVAEVYRDSLYET
jgi:hypothetical protein